MSLPLAASPPAGLCPVLTEARCHPDDAAGELRCEPTAMQPCVLLHSCALVLANTELHMLSACLSAGKFFPLCPSTCHTSWLQAYKQPVQCLANLHMLT